MDASESKYQPHGPLRGLQRAVIKGVSEPTNEHHTHRWEDAGEVDYDREEKARAGLHSNGHPEERRCAALTHPSPTKPPSNRGSATALPTSTRGKSGSSSPCPSVKPSSSISMHPVESQRVKTPIKRDTAIHNVQAKRKVDERMDTTSSVVDVYPSTQSLRRRSDRPPQRPGHILPAPMSQDNSHTTDVAQQQAYLLKACRALMAYGAPTHRLEEYMQMTAEVLGLHLQSFYMPGCMIVSFNDTVWRSTEVHMVRCTQALNLSKLYDVREVYKGIIHDKIAVEEATARLDEIMTRSDKFSKWFRVLMYGLASACIGPVSYGARPIDLPIIFLLGSLLGFMQLILAHNSELYAHIFEISATILTAFLSRAFGSIHSGPSRSFCFSAISQACLVMILPGFTITNSALELQSKNIVSGSVRMVYGIIYTLFLAFGITIGVTIYGAIDHNATSATICDATWPFWWQIIFVAPFTLCYIIINQGKWTKAPAMLILSLVGWLVNYFSAQHFATNTQIAQTLGALTVGILANLYSRLGHGLAVALLYPAIFIQVPGSLAASGSLISGLTSANQLTKPANGGLDSGGMTVVNGTGAVGGAQGNTALLNAGYSMIEIAIGITVGLSVSALVVYPFRKKRGKSGLFSF